MLARKLRGNYLSPAGSSLSASAASAASAASGISGIWRASSGICRVPSTCGQHQHHGVCTWRSGGEAASPPASDHSGGARGETQGKSGRDRQGGALGLADEDYLGWSGCWVSSSSSRCCHWRGSGWRPSSPSPPPSWSPSPWSWSSLAPLILVKTP